MAPNQAGVWNHEDDASKMAHRVRQVFDPYYRSEETAALPGVGLGLAISHGLVQQMGGALDLESQLGRGSTFMIRLPVLGPTS